MTSQERHGVSNTFQCDYKFNGLFRHTTTRTKIKAKHISAPARRQQAISGIYVDYPSLRSCDIHLRVITQEVINTSILCMSSKFTNSRLPLHLSGANPGELIQASTAAIHQNPLCWDGLTRWIIQVCIGNYIYCVNRPTLSPHVTVWDMWKVRDEIIYLVPKFKGCTVEVRNG